MIGAPLEFASQQLCPGSSSTGKGTITREHFEAAPTTSGMSGLSGASAISAEEAKQVKAMKAAQVWFTQTSPSVTGVVDMGDDPNNSFPGLFWYRFDQGYFANNPLWFTGLQASAFNQTSGWGTLDQLFSQPVSHGPPAALPNGQVSFSLLVKGYFIPMVTGIHQFMLECADAGYMWLGGPATASTTDKSIRSASIAIPGNHARTSRSVSYKLIAGTAYPLSIMYGQNAAGGDLHFSFTPPYSSAKILDGTGYFFSLLALNTVVATSVMVDSTLL